MLGPITVAIKQICIITWLTPALACHLERELVDGVDLVEVVEDEVEDGGAGGRRTVELAGLVDLKRSLLCLSHLVQKGKFGPGKRMVANSQHFHKNMLQKMHIVRKVRTSDTDR